MSYSRPITREHPSCLLFLIDQSGSMFNAMAGETMRKDEAVAAIVNRLIDIIGLNCTKGETVRHYFDLGIIGYGDEAVSLFEEESATPSFRPINVLYENPINLQSVIDNDEEPIWIMPKSEGVTAMCSAFRLAKNLLEDWVKRYPQSYPPTLFHISDGNSTDGDPNGIAEEIKQIQTDDGTVLIYNINIAETRSKAITYPSNKDELPGQYACDLFNMSSILPDVFRDRFYAQKKLNLEPQARAFIFNADPSLLAQCLNIGTPLNIVGD